MEAATARETQFEGGQRLVSRVLQLISGIDANDGLCGNELDVELLLDDGVARSERGYATGGPISGATEQEERYTGSATRFQSVTIVAGETDGGKKL